jgi:hypothetical protein
VILLPGIDLNEATMIAECLCEACEARALVHQHPAAKFTISIGVGTEALGASELGGLLRQTDAALYRAKRAGGNQVASGPGRFVQRYSAPSIERFPTRSAKPCGGFLSSPPVPGLIGKGSGSTATQALNKPATSPLGGFPPFLEHTL